MFARNKDFDMESEKEDAKAGEKSKAITCRHCQGNHWTTQCPYRDRIAGLGAAGTGTSGSHSGSLSNSGEFDAVHSNDPSIYAAPGLRNRDPSDLSSVSTSSRDGVFTVRVTNLSENTRESDLKLLFGHAGQVTRVFISKDRCTGRCKGYAFVSYVKRSEAERAICMLNNHGYDNLILKVEFAKYN